MRPVVHWRFARIRIVARKPFVLEDVILNQIDDRLDSGGNFAQLIG
jgi:hypothetical protein